MNPAHNMADCFRRFLVGMILCSMSSLGHGQWQTIATGIEFQDLNQGLSNPWSHIYAFKINLSLNQLSLKFASELHTPHASVQRLAQPPHILLAINGGFFDKDFRPLGLRISEGKIKNPRKKISWWGIFYIHRNKAYIASPKHAIPDNTTFAIQSGPRLIINNRIPSLKKGLAERSAIGIQDAQHVIVLITDNHRLTTHQLAEILKSEPLNCHNAINLDGGSSSQLFAKTKNFNLSVNGFSNVSDAIVVKEK